MRMFWRKTIEMLKNNLLLSDYMIACMIARHMLL